MPKKQIISRDNWVLDPKTTAVLVVDVQKSEVATEVQANRPEYYEAITARALPNQKRVLAAARHAGCEVMYTVIESLTRDGRDRSLDHKLSNMLIPKGSKLAEVIDDVSPIGDEIILPKTSSGVFNSTNIDYILRNLGIDTLITFGFVTDQCLDMAVRDSADKGYFTICISDACAAYTESRHEHALQAFGGYCVTLSSDEIISRLQLKT